MNIDIKNVLLLPLNLLYRVSPTVSLKILFRLKNGYKLDVKSPVTYNEKLQWIKLNYKNPLLTKLVDKYTVRAFVEQNAPEILNKLIWEGFDAKEIPWDTLPDRYVIKVTHGSGYNIIVKDKKQIDRKKYEKKLNRWLKAKFLRCYGEWFYGVEKPRIIIEEFLDAGEGKVPEDYKIFCFGGKAHYVIVDTDRFEGHKRNVYDMNWSFKEGITLNFPNDIPINKPDNFDELIKYAELLSKGFPHVRVDLYSVGGKVYFGEMTFTNGAGFDRIEPYDFDVEMGNYFLLP